MFLRSKRWTEVGTKLLRNDGWMNGLNLMFHHLLSLSLKRGLTGLQLDIVLLKKLFN